MKIKICGIRRKEDVEYLNETLPDFTGFIFADTRRKVTRSQAETLRELLDRRIKVFGVFVNAPLDFVAGLAQDGIIDVIQLHGDETEKYICELRERTRVPIIKAVRAKDRKTIEDADRLSCDFLLLDTYLEKQYGGTGKTFSWEMIPEQLEHPYLLAGGLDETNLRRAMESVMTRGNCLGVDVSGGVETDGYKDREKVKKVVELVHSFIRRREGC